MRFTKCRKLGITLIPSHVISAASPFDNWQQFQEIKFTFWVFCPRSERKTKLRWHFIMWQSGYWREWQRDFTSIIVSSTSRTEMCRMIHKELFLLPTIEIEAVLHFPFSPEWMLCLFWSLCTGFWVFIPNRIQRSLCKQASERWCNWSCNLIPLFFPRDRHSILVNILII